MKTVKKEGQYKRVSEVEADNLVSKGWSFCGKQEWKLNDRDVHKMSAQPATETTKKEKSKKKDQNGK